MSRGGESLFALLVRAHTVAQRLAADLLLECGVSVLEAWLLEEIPVTGDLCATEIARALGVPTSTVTRALRRLESYGYITLVKGTFLDTRVLRPVAKLVSVAKLERLGVSVMVSGNGNANGWGFTVPVTCRCR